MSRRAGRARTPAAPQSPHNANPVAKGLRRTRSVRPTTVPPPLSAAGAGKVRLGDVCEEVSVRNRDGKVSSVYSVTNSGGFIPSTEYFSKEVYSKSLATYKIVKPGMFAYNPSRINVGSVNRWIGEAPVIVSPLYIVVNPDPRRIEGSYLNYFLHSKEALCQIRNLTEGTVRDSLKFSGFQRLTLPLPPLPTQQRIADELDRLCALKKNAEDRLAILDQIVKSRFVEMFGDVRTNNKGWSIAPFEDAATIDGTLEEDFKRYADYPHIGIDSIAKGTGELVGYRTVAQDGVISGKYHFTAKHIIYSKIRPNLNKVALPDFEGLCSADAYAILPTEKADRVYLAYVLRSQFFLDYIIPLSGRTGMPKANRKQIQGFEFPLPPLALQREFAAFVAEVDKSKLTLRETVATLDQLYRAKLQEYFG